MCAARMTPSPMVHVRTVPTTFHARVIQARLGAEGIVAHLRGNVGGPYPLGDVSVWVDQSDAAAASELLLADEVEAAFVPRADDEESVRASPAWLFAMTKRQVLAAVALLVTVAVAALGRWVY